MKATVYGTLVLTGNPATLVCGGLDDGHYTIAATTETGHVIPGTLSTVFPVSMMQAMAIAPEKLALAGQGLDDQFQGQWS